MSDAASSLASSYSKAEKPRKSYSTPGKSNFKKFTLHHQNNSTQKFEETLHKTLDNLHSKADDTLKLSELNAVKNSPSRIRAYDTEKDINLLFDRRGSSLEDDHPNFRSPVEEIRFESSLIKSGQSSTKKIFPRERESELLRSGEGRRQRVKFNDEIENDLMRSRSKENSITSPKKYGSALKRSYNEVAFNEERSRSDFKRIKESYENEIIDLKTEIRRLRDELENHENGFFQHKERLTERIALLEKENENLISDMQRSNFIKSIESHRANINNNEEELKSTINQIMKEKKSVEEQYSDLLSSYSILLEHNRNLTTKFDLLEKERDELVEKTMRISHYSPRSEIEKLNLPKNKIDPIKRNSYREKEREIETKNKISNMTPKRENPLKKESKEIYQSPLPLKNSGIHQKARELLMEELENDINNFEERLKASTGSVDDTLNPKLPYGRISMSARQEFKGQSSRSSITQSESKLGAENKRILIEENLSSSRKRDNSRSKTKGQSSLPGSEGKLKEKLIEAKGVKASSTSNVKSTTKPQSSRALGKDTKPPSLPVNIQANSQPPKTSQPSSAKGVKVPLYSKVNKS